MCKSQVSRSWRNLSLMSMQRSLQITMFIKNSFSESFCNWAVHVWKKLSETAATLAPESSLNSVGFPPYWNCSTSPHLPSSCNIIKITLPCGCCEVRVMSSSKEYSLASLPMRLEILTVVTTSYYEKIHSSQCQRHTVVHRVFCFWKFDLLFLGLATHYRESWYPIFYSMFTTLTLH